MGSRSAVAQKSPPVVSRALQSVSEAIAVVATCLGTTRFPHPDSSASNSAQPLWKLKDREATIAPAPMQSHSKTFPLHYLPLCSRSASSGPTGKAGASILQSGPCPRFPRKLHPAEPRPCHGFPWPCRLLRCLLFAENTGSTSLASSSLRKAISSHSFSISASAAS